MLLSGPEQLLEVRRLLRGEAEDGGGNWPERLRPALGTRGFAAELRDFLLRAAERGLDGRGLARLGRLRQRGGGGAAGGFLDRRRAGSRPGSPPRRPRKTRIQNGPIARWSRCRAPIPARHRSWSPRPRARKPRSSPTRSAART